MADTLTFTLAGAPFTVRRLTLRQMRDLQIGAVKAVSPSQSLEDRVTDSYDSDLGIIATALSRDNPECTVEWLYDLETTKAEVSAVAVEILKFSGLITSGEAEAATE